MSYCSVFTQSGTLMNKLVMTGTVPVTGCLTLICQGAEGVWSSRQQTTYRFHLLLAGIS